LQASYCVVHLFAKESEPLSYREFVRKCSQDIVQEIFSEKETVFSTISLSHATLMQQVEGIGNELINSETK
jgi:hypothetical protein